MISRHRRIIRIMTGLHPLSAARKGVVDRVTGGGEVGGKEGRGGEGEAREDGGCTVCRVNCRLACRCGRTPVQAHANVTGRHGGKGE